MNAAPHLVRVTVLWDYIVIVHNFVYQTLFFYIGKFFVIFPMNNYREYVSTGAGGAQTHRSLGYHLLHLQILRPRAVSFPHVVQISCRKLGYSSCHFKTRHDKMHCCIKCPQILQVKTLLPTYTAFTSRIHNKIL